MTQTSSSGTGPAPKRPARVWRLTRRELAFSSRPVLMGIVNVTPDSFSDGGRYFDPQRAIEHGLQLEADGAGILDIGGESTRPYSQPVDLEEELRRVIPVVKGLANRAGVPLSIDTSKPEVARAALDVGAEIVNDVTGLRDESMLALVRDRRAGVCAMHMQGTPATMQDHPTYGNVVAEVGQWLNCCRDRLVAHGIKQDRIALDPGIGFGKTHEHNRQLVQHCHEFHESGSPLVVGPSRKAFIGKLLGDMNADRDPGTAGIVLLLASQGVQVVRVHNVGLIRQALDAFEAAGQDELFRSFKEKLAN